MLAINPKIKQKAEDIRKKIFGSEVRESLASGIEAISEDVESIKGRQGNVENQFQDVLDETTGKDVISAPELIAARNGKSNLKTRLDDEHAQVTAQLQQNTSKVNAVDLRIDNLVVPLSPENTNIEVSDAHNSIVKNKNFQSLKGRFEEVESDFINFANLKIENGIENGNGYSGVDGWTGNNTTETTNNGEGITGTNVGAGGDFAMTNNATLQQNAGDKIYISFYVKGNSVKTCGSRSLPLVYPTFTFIPTTEPKHYSYITEATEDSTHKHRFYISGAETGDNLTVSKVMQINLSKAFGFGNEPGIEEFEGYLKELSNGWFEGTLGLGTIESKMNKNDLKKLKYDTGLNITNKFVNGDFSNGTSGWLPEAYADFTVDNGVGKMLAISDKGGMSRNGLVQEGHIYYLAGDIKADSNMVALALGSTFSYHSGNSEYERLSLLHKATAKHEKIVYDYRDTDHTYFYMRNFLLIDLTEEFGEGNEPTFDEIEHMLGILPNKFFMGVANVNDAKNLFPLYRKESEGVTSLKEDVTSLKEDVNPILERMLFYPNYIRPMLNDVAERVRLVQNENTFSFGFITDTHSEDKTMHHIGTIAEMSKYTPLSFIAHGGDITDGFLPKPDEFKLIRDVVSRLQESKVPILFTKGNHDDNNFYARGVRGDAIPYQTENFTKDIELYNQIVKFSEKDIVIGSKEELYYYIDDEDSKTRTIIWNCFDIPWVDNNGVKALSCMHNKGINNNQLNWIANNALKFEDKETPSDWGVVMISHYVHTPIKNFDILLDIIDAFSSGGSYSNSGTFTHLDDNTGNTLEFPFDVSVDFTNQGSGEFITFVSGDVHMDRITTAGSGKYRSILTLNASLAKDQASAPVKTNLTETETAWDIFTIDRDTRTINMTRFGAGEDRVTTY